MNTQGYKTLFQGQWFTVKHISVSSGFKHTVRQVEVITNVGRVEQKGFSCPHALIEQSGGKM